jgi:hypothetical protein
MTFHATTPNFDGNVITQYRDPNSRHWRGTALALFESKGYGDAHDFDSLVLANPGRTYQSIAKELKELNHE